MQIRSVRPEDRFGPYVEWFSHATDAHSRIAITEQQDAFSYLWDRRFYSWVFPPFGQVANAAQKFLADSSRGCFVCRTTPQATWFTALRTVSSVIFSILPDIDNLSASAPQPAHLTAFIIDPRSDMHDEPRLIELTLPPQWRSRFRSPKCPFNHDAWQTALSYHPDAPLVTRMLRGIKFGRAIGYTGDRFSHRICKNPPSYDRFRTELTAIQQKEAAKNWRSGPFPISPRLPLFNLVCSPVRGATKRFSDKIRLVKNLSFDAGGICVNRDTTQGTTRNISILDICALIRHFGKGTLIYVFDVEAAYKQISLVLEDCHLQGDVSPDGVSWSSVLDFGGANSGHLWEDVGSLYEFVIRYHTAVSAIVRYVDDCIALIAPLPDGSPNWPAALRVIDQIERVSSRLGVSIPLSKRKGPACCVDSVLGWTLDSTRMQISVTDERRLMCLSMLAVWRHKHSASIKELQSLVGLLHYLVVVIRWGKAFLGHAFKLSRSLKHPAARVFLSEGFRADMRWWHQAVTEWSGISIFLDERWTTNDELGFEVDASRLGHGAFCFPDWYSHPWSEHELSAARRKSDLSMPYLETRAFAFACATFGSRWTGRKIIARSDCKPAIDAINARYSSDPGMRDLIRTIGLLACRYQFDLQIVHIAGVLNVRADPLSRLCVPDFKSQAPLRTASSPTPLSPLPTLTC